MPVYILYCCFVSLVPLCRFLLSSPTLAAFIRQRFVAPRGRRLRFCRSARRRRSRRRRRFTKVYLFLYLHLHSYSHSYSCSRHFFTFSHYFHVSRSFCAFRVVIARRVRYIAVGPLPVVVVVVVFVYSARCVVLLRSLRVGDTLSNTGKHPSSRRLRRVSCR